MPYNRKSKKNLRPRWKPGQSGNPEGRAWGSYGYKRLVNEMFRRAYEADKLLSEEEPAGERSIPAVEVAKPTELRIPCSVCRNEGRAVIDGLLTLGIPLRAIARSCGFSKSSVERHKRRHLPVFPNVEKARQMKPIEEGLWQILNSRDGMRLSGPMDGAPRALERLWELNRGTATGSPLDQLRIATIVAFSYLFPILGRHPWDFRNGEQNRKQNMKDYEAAIEVLKSWGRDNGAQKTS